MNKPFTALRAVIAIAAVTAALLFSGCQAMEHLVGYQPKPLLRDMSAHLDRGGSSTLQAYFTEGTVPTRVAVYDNTGTYLSIQEQVMSTIDVRGHATFLVGTQTGTNPVTGQWTYAPINPSRTYFIILEVRSSTWNYSAYNSWAQSAGWQSGGYNFNCDGALTSSPATMTWRDDPNGSVTEVRSVDSYGATVEVHK